MPVTIKEIAAQSGLSIQTVSRILGSKGNLHRPDTQERVLQTARELGYLTNSSARAMRQGRFGCVSLLLSTEGTRSLLPIELLDGIQDALAEHNLHLSVARLSDDKLVSAGYVPKILREAMSDGLLINYNADIPPQMIHLLERHAVPGVWINSQQAADCVFPDDLQAGRHATEHLLALGHQRIAYVDWCVSTHYSARDRRQGYLDAMRTANRKSRIIEDGLDVAGGPPALRASWLARPDRPTAVVTYGPHMALPVVYAAGVLGLSVPRDLSVITFDARINDSLGRPVDSMLLPERALGRTAVQMLREKIENPDVRHAPRALPAELQGGWTCAAPPAQ